jgi:hypothetical protein
VVWQIFAVVVWIAAVLAVSSLFRRKTRTYWRRFGHNARTVGVGALVFVLVGGSSAGVYYGVGTLVTSDTTNNEQKALEPFYHQFEGTTGTPGELLAKEEIAGVKVPGAIVYRILYRSLGHSGESTISSGMAFVPRKATVNQLMIGWAHPTSGLGDACAPSRTKNHLIDTNNWLNQMMSNGWVVAATDYAGLGTPGVSYYLDGISEAADVTFSVKAAAQLPNVHAGKNWAAWGHSQGGHAALWTGELAKKYAPDMNLVAVATAAPAAELNLIMGAQWPNVVGWVIGPEVAQGLPKLYPNMTLDGIVSKSGQSNGATIAMECISDAAISGLSRQDLLGEHYFISNPVTNKGWSSAMEAETPKPLTTVPVLVSATVDDKVVLAWPNAVLQKKWCDAGSSLDMMWVGDVNHQQVATTVGPSVVLWLSQRFAGAVMHPNCALPAPVSAPTN